MPDNSILEQNRTPETPSSSVANKTPKIRLKKNVLIIIGLLILIPLFLFIFSSFRKQPEDINKNNPVLAHVREESIRKNVLLLSMQETYGPKANEKYADLTLRQQALDTLITAKIIDQEIQMKGIRVTQEEIQREKQKESQLVEGEGFEVDDQVIAQEILTNKLTNSVVTNRVVDRAFVYKNGDDTEGIARAQESLRKMRELVLTGSTVKQAYEALLSSAGFDTSIVVTEGMIAKEPEWQKQEVEKLLPLHTGDTSEIIDLGGGTSILVKVLSENNTGYATFDQWLQKTKEESVSYQ